MSKILVVDDEPQIVLLTQTILENADYKVTSALNGEKCLKILEKNTFDLILLDVRMPGENGWEICKKIKADKKTMNIPIVMFTVKTSPNSVNQGKEAGAIGQINKPFESEDVLAITKRILKKS